MDNTVEEVKDHSLLLKIMYKAVERVIAKGFGGKADYENPEFRMLMASSVGSPLGACRSPAASRAGSFRACWRWPTATFSEALKK